jgi:hypothetical protein
MSPVTVYVVGNGAATSILVGSAIVGGTPHTAGPRGTDVATDSHVTVDFEGGIYDTYTHLTPAARWLAHLSHATDRHHTRYPTVARATLHRDHLHPVGTYDPERGTLDIDDPATLDQWLVGCDSAAVTAEFLHTQRQHHQRQLAQQAARGDTKAYLALTRHAAHPRATIRPIPGSGQLDTPKPAPEAIRDAATDPHVLWASHDDIDRHTLAQRATDPTWHRP